MIQKRVISHKNLSSNPHTMLLDAAVVWLFFDRYHVPGWIYGVVFTVLGIAFIGCLTSIWNEVEVDVLEKK